LMCRPVIYVTARSTYIVTAGHCRHPSALGIEGIQDEVMDEDDKAKVKSKDHGIIKIKAQRTLKFIRQAEAAVVKIGIYVKDRTVLA
jgi:hypothetical protein